MTAKSISANVAALALTALALTACGDGDKAAPGVPYGSAPAPTGTATPSPSPTVKSTVPAKDTRKATFTAADAAGYAMTAAFADCTRLTGAAKSGDAIADLVSGDVLTALRTKNVLWTDSSGQKVRSECVTDTRVADVATDTKGATEVVGLTVIGNLHFVGDETAYTISQRYVVSLIPSDSATGWTITSITGATPKVG